MLARRYDVTRLKGPLPNYQGAQKCCQKLLRACNHREGPSHYKQQFPRSIKWELYTLTLQSCWFMGLVTTVHGFSIPVLAKDVLGDNRVGSLG